MKDCIKSVILQAYSRKGYEEPQFFISETAFGWRIMVDENSPEIEEIELLGIWHEISKKLEAQLLKPLSKQHFCGFLIMDYRYFEYEGT